MSSSMRSAGAVVLGAVLVLAGSATARPDPTPEQMREKNRAALQGTGISQQPVRRGRVIRRPVIDLEKQALQRRPGQVLPGDPPPEKFSAPMQEPSKPAKEVIQMQPPSPQAVVPPAGERDASTGRTMKAAPSPLVPEENAAPVQTPAPTPAAPAPKNEAPAPAPAAEPNSAPKVESTAEHVSVQSAASAASTGTPAAVPAAPAEPVNVVARPVGRDPRLVSHRPAALAAAKVGTPAWVRVEGVFGSAGVQWRVLGDEPGPWSDAPTHAAQQGRIELRTGLDAAAMVRVNDRVTVRVAPLSRVVVESSVDTHLPMLAISRGSVEVVESSGIEGTLVRTPDLPAGMPVQPGSRVGYSAFTGIRVVPLASAPR